jgi:hypothetical protein
MPRCKTSIYIHKMLRLLKENQSEYGTPKVDDGGDGDDFKSSRVKYDTRFFDGVSHLLVIADRKTNSQINRSKHSHTKNQARKVIKFDCSTSIRATHETSFLN